MNQTIVWVAQGLGIGRIPFAPGTFGSVLGILFFLALVSTGPLLFSLLVVLSVFVSVAFCSAAEKILGQTDPGSVVIDEIIAMPICFATWVSVFFVQHGTWPSAGYFISKQNWPIAVGIFLLFRVFDIWKPWPVRQSQELRGGWGVTIDDVLAAGYVNLCFAIYYFALRPVI